MKTNDYLPVQGSYIFNALYDQQSIVMACNTRIVEAVAKGILRAAKEVDSAVIFEIAKSESDLKGGYIGLTPEDFASRVKQAAKETQHDIWALHADHITIKKGTKEEVEQTKELINHQIKAGFTSFAIDASFLFNIEGTTPEEELKDNIRVTIELAKHIEQKYGSNLFGLETEVGEIGKKNDAGLVVTKPEEAVCYIKALNDAGVKPQVLAIANGSTHGNIYDTDGKPIAQVTIDIPQTKKVAQALHDNALGVRIAQHGITGTPLEIIKEQFPHGEIIKGNVGTLWMNIVWDVFKEKAPELYDEIYKWTLETFKEEAAAKGMKTDEQIFGLYGKKAIKQFFDKIYSVNEDVKKAVEERAYDEALKFFDAFKSNGSAQIVRDYIKTKLKQKQESDE